MLGGLAIGGWTSAQSEKYKPIKTTDLQIVDKDGRMKAYFLYDEDKETTWLALGEKDKPGVYTVCNKETVMTSMYDADAKIITSIIKKQPLTTMKTLDKPFPALSLGVMSDNSGSITTYDAFGRITAVMQNK